jgi:GH24 family phage-related lysozyme (muramidase)
VDLNQNQYDAMLDFAFNAGITSKGRRPFLAALNSCDFPALFAYMRKIVTSKGKRLQELVGRREYEIALFQK